MFLPIVQCVQFFHPALPRASAQAILTPQLIAQFPELPTRLHELAEENIMQAARLHLRVKGIEATPEALEVERLEMARLHQKYSS
jgi:hypothetical protein